MALGMRDKALRNSLERLETLTREMAGFQTDYVQRARLLLETMALHPHVRGLDPKGCGLLFDKILESHPELANIVLTDPRGLVIASGKSYPANLNMADRTAFIDAVASGRFSAGDYIFSRILDRPVLQFALPLSNDEGGLAGVLLTAIDLKKHKMRFDEMILDSKSRLILTDRTGTRLLSVSKDAEPRPIGKKIPEWNWRIMAQAESDQGHFFSSRSDAQAALYCYIRLRLRPQDPVYMVVFMNTPLTVIQQEANQTIRNNLALLALAAVLALVFSRVLGNKLLFNQVKALRQSEERLRAIADNTYDWEYWRGPDGAYVWVSPACEALSGVNAVELAGEAEEVFAGLVHPEDRPLWEKHILDVDARQPDHREIEFRMIKPTGEIVWVAHTCKPIFGPEGEFLGRRGCNRDITERKKAELAVLEAKNAMEKNELFLESLVENLPVMLFVKDAENLRFIRINRAGEVLLGYSREELLGKNDYDLFAPEQANAFNSNDRTALVSREVLDIPEERLATKCLGQRILHTKKVPILKEDGTPLFLLGISEDITERKHADEDLLAAKEAAETANKAKSTFLANMSHEIRTPLNGVYGMLQLMKNTALDEEQKQFIEVGLKAIRRLSSLLSDILDLSRIESGRLSVLEKKFEVLSLEEAVLELFQIPAKEKGLALSFTVSPAMPRVLVGDESRVRQILFNLVGNAIKFTETGEVAIEVHPLSSILDPRFHVLFMVRDTGIGIADEQLRTIFDPFVQVEESYVRRYQGAGLGLSIVASLVRLLGGGLAVDSEPGKGTTLYVSLPFVMPSALPAPDAKRQNAAPASRKANVLVVEDDATTSFAVMRHLEKSGHHVAVAPNGRECLAKLRAKASMISSTSTSGADAPAVMPSAPMPSRAFQSRSEARWMRKARAQPSRAATSRRRCELDELGAPTTSMASTFGATSRTAACRFVVA